MIVVRRHLSCQFLAGVQRGWADRRRINDPQKFTTPNIGTPSGSQTALLAARLVRGRLRLRLSSPEEVAEARVYRLGERRRVDRV